MKKKNISREREVEVYGRMILKYIFDEYVVSVESELKCFRIGRRDW
jgi:hypothetical protein